MQYQHIFRLVRICDVVSAIKSRVFLNRYFFYYYHKKHSNSNISVLYLFPVMEFGNLTTFEKVLLLTLNVSKNIGKY